MRHYIMVRVHSTNFVSVQVVYTAACYVWCSTAVIVVQKIHSLLQRNHSHTRLPIGTSWVYSFWSDVSLQLLPSPTDGWRFDRDSLCVFPRAGVLFHRWVDTCAVVLSWITHCPRLSVWCQWTFSLGHKTHGSNSGSPTFNVLSQSCCPQVTLFHLRRAECSGGTGGMCLLPLRAVLINVLLVHMLPVN